jgi:hypothetical protein
MINDLREAIWHCYSLELLDQYRDHGRPAVPDRGDKDFGDLPF